MYVFKYKKYMYAKLFFYLQSITIYLIKSHQDIYRERRRSVIRFESKEWSNNMEIMNTSISGRYCVSAKRKFTIRLSSTPM